MKKPRGAKSGCLGAGNFSALRTELQKKKKMAVTILLEKKVQFPVEEKLTFRAHEAR
jgi:hypothetical protein